MGRHVVPLTNDRLRQTAIDYVRKAKDGSRVEFKGPRRSTDQNSKMWACLSDIARQIKWADQWLTADDWKLLFLDALRREHGDQLRLVPNLDRTGVLSLSTSSSDLDREEMGDLITIISAFGDNHGVEWSEPKKPGDGRPTPPVSAYVKENA